MSTCNCDCDYCPKNGAYGGFLLPTSPDDREVPRDGKVWVERCDQCYSNGCRAGFGSDALAADAIARVTGWPVHKSYDRDDELDPLGRAAKAGTDHYRPYFDVSLSDAERWEQNRTGRHRVVPRTCRRCGALSTGGAWCPMGCGKL